MSRSVEHGERASRIDAAERFETRSFAADIGMLPRRTPYRSPQSNGMAEAFVKTFKRDYVRLNPMPDAQSVLSQLHAWFSDYNRVHPHSALQYRSPDQQATGAPLS
jgi:putative transposase